ncbi:MAG: reverse transcriptase domain-containing protein [Ginsengibacter sp.]
MAHRREVLSVLLANLYLHVVFDGWMKQHYPGIRFERYADDIIIHAFREQIAQSILKKLQARFTTCGITIHPTKTQIISLNRSSTKRSEHSVHTFEMGGYEFKPQWVKGDGEWKFCILPSTSKASKKAIMDKVRSLKIHTRTGEYICRSKSFESIGEGLAKLLLSLYQKRPERPVALCKQTA